MPLSPQSANYTDNENQHAPQVMEAQTAGRQLASTPELLEMILLQLPVVDILLAQRVNKTWQATIANSPKLQRALFFRPVDDPVVSNFCRPATVDCEARGWCITRDRGSCERGEHHYPPVWQVANRPTKSYDAVFINPFIFRVAPALCPWGVIGPNEVPFETADATKKRERRLSGSAIRPEASWRKMLLTQPPMLEAFVHHERAQHWHFLAAGDRKSGITIAEHHRQTDLFKQRVYRIHGDHRFMCGNAWITGIRSFAGVAPITWPQAIAADVLGEVEEVEEGGRGERQERDVKK